MSNRSGATFVRRASIDGIPPNHGDGYPATKFRLVKGRGTIIPSVMQLAEAVETGPLDSRNYDPPEGHRHKTGVEWYIIQNGWATFGIGNPGEEDIFEAGPGDCIVVPPDTPHWHTVPDGVTLRITYGLNATDAPRWVDNRPPADA